MSDFRTIQEFQQHQEETAIPKLRWWQVQALAEKFPNNQDLGAEVRKLVNKNTN
jgi:hypothetical protein